MHFLRPLSFLRHLVPFPPPPPPTQASPPFSKKGFGRKLWFIHPQWQRRKIVIFFDRIELAVICHCLYPRVPRFYSSINIIRIFRANLTDEPQIDDQQRAKENKCHWMRQSRMKSKMIRNIAVVLLEKTTKKYRLQKFISEF